MLRIEIETENAAFGESEGGELARILRDLADKLEPMESVAPPLSHHLPVFDLNGNSTGFIRVLQL